MDIFANDAKCLRRSECDVTAYLRLNDFLCAEAERRRVRVTGLFFERLPANGAAIETGRCYVLPGPGTPEMARARIDRVLADLG